MEKTVTDQIREPRGAGLSVRIGEAVDVEARISVAGLLATGALVGGILLASAVIVRTAKRRPGDGAPMLPSGERS